MKYFRLAIIFCIFFLSVSCRNENNVKKRFYSFQSELNENSLEILHRDIKRPGRIEAETSLIYQSGQLKKVILEGMMLERYQKVVFFLEDESLIFVKCEAIDSSKFLFFIKNDDRYYYDSNNDLVDFILLDYDPCFSLLDDLWKEGVHLFN